MHLLSLAPLTIGNAGPLETIAAAAAGRFDAVGLRLLAAPGTPPPEPVIGSPRAIAEIGTRLADSGLAVLSATGIWLTPETRVGDLLPALETAATLGARYFLTVGNDPEPARLGQNFAGLAERAAGFGLALAVEFMPAAQINSLAAAHRLVEGIVNAGILVDALHLARSGGTPAEVAAVAPIVAYLQLCDAPAASPPPGELRREAQIGRLHPGEGALPLAELLDSSPVNLPIDLETPVARDAALSRIERAIKAATAARQFLALQRRGKA